MTGRFSAAHFERRLIASGALLRCWKRNKGEFYNEQTANMEALGMHHYEGVAGAERLAARSVAPRWLRERAERPSSGTAAMAPGSCTCCPHPLGRCV